MEWLSWLYTSASFLNGFKTLIKIKTRQESYFIPHTEKKKTFKKDNTTYVTYKLPRKQLKAYLARKRYSANEQPCKDARLWGRSLIEPCAIVPGPEKISNRYVRQHLWPNTEQRLHCFRANAWYSTENPRAKCVLVNPVFIPPYLHLHLQHVRMTAHLPAGIFHCMPLRKIIK